MIASICMVKGMQCIVFIHSEIFAGNKDRTGCSKGNVALAIANRSCSHSCRSIVACTCYNLHIF